MKFPPSGRRARGRETRFMLKRLVVGLLLGVPVRAAGQADTARTDTVRLEPVKVEVTRGEPGVEGQPRAISVIGLREFRLGIKTVGLDEVLPVAAGILAQNRYNPSQDMRISIRGFGARSSFGIRGVKIMLDGIPQTLPDGQGQLTNIDVAEVQRVEVLRGASSSLYGNASGGVVSLTTGLPRPERAIPFGRLVAGAFGLVKWQAGVNLPVGAGSGVVSLSRTVSDGYRQHSNADVRQLGVRFEHPLSRRTDLLVAVHAADDPLLENPGALTREQFADDPTQADPRNVAADARKDVSQTQAGVTLRHRADNGGRYDVSVFGLHRDLFNPLTFATIQIDRWAYGLRGASTLPVSWGSGIHLLTLGLDLQRQRDDRTNVNPAGEVTLDQIDRVSEVGPFAQLLFAVSPVVNLNLGLRYDWINFSVEDRLLSNGDQSGDRLMSAPSWNVGVALTSSTAVQPYATIGTAFETPTTTELVNDPTGSGGLNPNLEAQRALNVELGVRGAIGGRLGYNASIFNTNVRDELVPFQVPEVPDRTFFRNAGSARHRGIEVEATWWALQYLQVVGAYTLADYTFREFVTSDGVFNGNEIPGVPSHYLHLSLRLETEPGLWATLDNTYSSAFFVDDANTPIFRNEPWYTLGVRAGWTGRVGGWSVSPYVGLLNLFDEHYAASAVVNARGNRYYEPAPDRNVYVGVSALPGN